MVKEIRIYIEGGGDHKDTKTLLRKGFGIFLEGVRDKAREQRIGWRIVACGSRDRAYDIFLTALRTHPQFFNVLLVDSEGPVTQSPWEHLRDRDKWADGDRSDDQCHLMVQMMEAWLIADQGALESFYGEGFNRNPLPNDPDVEQIDKNRLEKSLKDATKDTQKGKYDKGDHSPRILEKLSPDIVRQKARHCDRLFNTLLRIIETK